MIQSWQHKGVKDFFYKGIKNTWLITLIIIREEKMIMHKPLHPGEIVREAVCNEETGLSVSEAANHLGVQRTTLSRLFNGHSGLSPEMALRLAMFLGTSVEMWLNIQRDYDVWKVQHSRPRPKVKKIKLAA